MIIRHSFASQDVGLACSIANTGLSRAGTLRLSFTKSAFGLPAATV